MQDIVAVLGQAWITSVMLLAVRIAALLFLTPVLYAVSMPAPVRLAIVLGLACVIALPLAGSGTAAVVDVGALIQAVLVEASIGATLGLGVLAAFAGFGLAGRLIDIQVGFGIAQVFDPLTRSRLPILSAIFGLFAAVFFFTIEGHHALMRGLAYSVELFPIGQGWTPAAAAEPVLKQFGALFALGFALAAPVVLGLLLVEFALGVVSRNLPQMNMLAMGIPVKIAAGLLALSVWATGFGAPASRLYAAIYQSWTGWFAQEGRR
ncbi:MAG TPA: flagellar biosynthetic protein FliR [Ramlibacter sp.]|uniref:flagellar biosynthetic protein FliR n=1 Tax=Ramlibacter sp. TaxID=1917967 RepID=UPI002ED3E97C